MSSLVMRGTNGKGTELLGNNIYARDIRLISKSDEAKRAFYELGIPAALNDEDEECDRSEEPRSNCSSGDSVSDEPNLWVHETSGLLRPVFRCLDIDSSTWLGLEKTAKSSPAKHHIGAFTRLLSEEASDASIEMVEQEMALAKAVDAMVHSIRSSLSIDAKKEKHQEYENECREKYAVPEVKSKSVDKDKVKEESDAAAERKSLEAGVVIRDGSNRPEVVEDDKSDKSVDEKAVETMVACSAMVLQKSRQLKNEDAASSSSTWAKWKRGGIIGAAALTGGTLWPSLVVRQIQPRLAVEVLVAGVVFEEEDFVKPWQGLSSSLERTLGADHFFVTCHDVGVRAFEGSPLLLKNTIRVVCSPSYNVGFIPHKDVALPQVLQPFALPAGGNDVENRTTLGFWAGHRNSKIHVILARV
ncbi:hypothetical protein Bca4012_038034 [Brassica carinata]